MRSRIPTMSALLLLLLSCTSCRYTLSSFLPGHIKTIAIPYVENATDTPELTEEVTQSLRDRFTEDNTLLVVDLGRADSMLMIRITDFKNVLYEQPGFDSDGYIAFLVIDSHLQDLHDNRILWEEEGVEEHVIYERDEELSLEEREASLRATLTDRHARRILDRTVNGW